MIRIGVGLLCLFALVASSTRCDAQSPSVEAIFAQYNLLGTLAIGCGKPVARDNLYYAHRPIAGGRVQRDQMSSATTRDFVVIWERAMEIAPNMVALSGTRDGQPAESVYRMEPGRMRVMEATVAGRKEVTGGKSLNGSDRPWVYRCEAGNQPRTPNPSPPTGLVKFIFERRGLIGTFAADCTQPPSSANPYFVNRLMDADHVQRDQMSSATARDAVTVLDRAEDRSPTDLFVSGTRNNQTAEAIWRIEGTRQVGWEVTLDGKKVVSGGRFNNGQEAKWLNKCG